MALSLKKRRVYYRAYDGQYCSLYRGANPRREYHDEPPKTLRRVPAPPADDADYPQPEWYLGRRRQWRVTAHVDFDWDRQGVHIPVGLLVGALATTDGGLGLAILVAAVFLVYEIRESGSINDLDWIDIGAALSGLIAWSVGWLTNAWWGWWPAAAPLLEGAYSLILRWWQGTL